ncbi:unnamed protein product [Durusdinium trenchii]|uniref:Post-GPI attachment to proteins factor 3 n=2 Tax=Durusdinium trenchii TaxID=1381693 RepID=A0ABP0L022_9DINO
MFIVKDDADCWMGAVNYDLCCRNHYGSPHCWGDSAFTFERCCTLRLGKGSHEFFSEARKFLLASWPQQLLMLGSLLLGLKSSAPSKKVPRLIPAVPQLRLLATLWIAAFHVWNLLEPLYPGSDDVKLLESLAVVHTDVFFIVSSYLIAKRPKGFLLDQPPLCSAVPCAYVFRQLFRPA